MNTFAKHILNAVVIATAWFVLDPGTARAGNCTVGACGEVENETDHYIRVSWRDADEGPWSFGYVSPHTHWGGDGFDLDKWEVPAGCTDKGYFDPVIGVDTPFDRSAPARESLWIAFGDHQTVVIEERTCTATPPPPPPPPPPPTPSCSGPSGWPGPRTHIRLWQNAPGRSGTSSSCPQVGSSRTDTNPQYIFCRRWGDEVRDARGNYNHWWLWTDLDTGGRGWISAYYIAGQGNDQANDMNTGRAIPNCR